MKILLSLILTFNLRSAQQLTKEQKEAIYQATHDQAVKDEQAMDASRKAAVKADKKRKKEKKPDVPTQSDVIEGCMAVRQIVFKRARFMRLNENTGVSGVIDNACRRDASINVLVQFYDRYGNMTTMDYVTKLVRPGTTPFWSGPDFRSSAAATSEVGKVLSISVTLL
jgi:hypothetical protein